MDKSQQLQFVSLGQFILDDVHFAPLADGVTLSRPPALNIAGGAGSYAAIGARIMSPGRAAASVGWVVDAGHDFPSELRQVSSATRGQRSICRSEPVCGVFQDYQRLGDELPLERNPGEADHQRLERLWRERASR